MAKLVEVAAVPLVAGVDDPQDLQFPFGENREVHRRAGFALPVGREHPAGHARIDPGVTASHGGDRVGILG